MTELRKAELVEVSSGDNPQPQGTPDAVQFNPTSLRVQISNRTAGGHQAGAQARQRPGTGEMQVSFDLIFDTADDGTDVLRKTAMVERYVRPQGNAPGQEAPPRVQFKWGTFLVQGTMDSANIDLDLFDAEGTPLRAKVSVVIKGQDPRWTYTPSPGTTPAASTGPSTQAAVNGAAPAAGAPGTSGTNRPPERVVQAMPGESLSQLAARNGLDPAAWRALADSIGDPLNLTIGQEVPLPAAIGGGAPSGALGRDPAQTASRLPLVNGSARGAGVATREPVRSGQAVASQGGLSAAISRVRQQDHRQDAGNSLSAFGLNPSGTGDAAERPWGAGVPLRPRFGGNGAGARNDPAQPGAVPMPRGDASGPKATTKGKPPRRTLPICGERNT